MRIPLGRAAWAALLLLIGCGGGSGVKPGVDASRLPGADGGRNAAGGSSGTGDNSGGTPAASPLPALPTYLGRIVVTPAALLFTKAGERATLQAEAFDASGRKMPATFTWESSKTAAATVDGGGQVTAMTALGSSQIRVRAGGLVSAPVMVVMAEPAAGAVLVSDAQVVAGPTPVDPALATEVGSKVKLSVTDVATLAPGTILLAREGKAVAGRVVSATSVAGQLDVVLETIPLLDLFKRLSVDSSYDIDAASMAEALAVAPTPLPLRLPGGIELHKQPLNLGPLKCETKLLGGALTGDASVDLRPNMTFNSRFLKNEDTGEWTELMARLEGKLVITGTVSVGLSAMLTGTAACDVVIVKIPVPVAGALSALVRFEIPLSIKGEIGATIALAPLKAQLELKGESMLTLGFQYTALGGMKDLGAYENKFTLTPTFDIPGVNSPLATLTASLSFGGVAGVNISALVGSLSLLEASLMLKAEAKTGPIRNGIAFSSGYDLKPVIEAGAGDDVKKAMSWFGGAVTVKSAITLTLPTIGQSPKGKFTADKMSVKPLLPVKLTMNLDPEWLSFLGLHNVVDVKIYRTHRTDVGWELLDTISGSPGKTAYSYSYTPTYLDADAGSVSFWAGVSTKLMPGLALEDMSMLNVKVGPGGTLWKGSVTVTCKETSMDPVNKDTFSEEVTATVNLEHLTEADALAANAKATGSGTAMKKNTHDYRAGTPGCPIDVHEEYVGMATEFQPILFQTKFHDDTGDYNLVGGGQLVGKQHLIHIEKNCTGSTTTRNDPESTYKAMFGYNINEKVAPDATSFSGSKELPGDPGSSCTWSWSFSR